ncbi:MAG: hypothetical protein ACYTEK_09815 [Planctomycetota bacterium]|jgi:hypothetical protein
MMKARKKWIAGVVSAVIVVATGHVTHVVGRTESPAGPTSQVKYVGNQRDALTGLQGVCVVVEEFRPEAKKYGLTKQAVQTDVELRLRQYGVNVLSLEEFVLMAMRMGEQPILRVAVSPLVKEESSVAAVHVLVELREWTFLRRSPMTCVKSITWKEDFVLLAGSQRLSEVRDTVKDLVDEFINDYLAANPKERPPEQKSERPLD